MLWEGLRETRINKMSHVFPKIFMGGWKRERMGKHVTCGKTYG